MLQNEHLRLPVGANIPEAFHADLDRLARWIRGGQWLEVEADLILEAMLEYIDRPILTIREAYRLLCLRVVAMSDIDDRDYQAPSFKQFRHLLVSLPKPLVKPSRLAREGEAHASHSRTPSQTVAARGSSSL